MAVVVDLVLLNIDHLFLVRCLRHKRYALLLHGRFADGSNRHNLVRQPRRKFVLYIHGTSGLSGLHSAQQRLCSYPIGRLGLNSDSI